MQVNHRSALNITPQTAEPTCAAAAEQESQAQEGSYEKVRPCAMEGWD